MKHTSNILFFSFLTILLACYKNEEIVTTEKVDDPPKITISTTHVIQVKDENGKSINDFTTTVAGEQISISNGGVALFHSKNINKHGEVITLKDNIGNTTKLLLSGVENDINYHHLTLYKSKNISDFKSSEGKNLVIDQNLSISCIPGSYLDNNVVYTSDVNATFYHVNPNNRHHLSGLPAVRRGINNTGVHHFLNIRDAFYLELKGNQSNILQAKLSIEGYEYEIKKGELKLWYCDLNAAVWKEISLSSENNIYQFVYKNAGFYCFATSTPGVYASGKITYKNKAVSNLYINFKEFKSETFTTASGRWISFLPSSTDVKTEISSECSLIQEYNLAIQSTPIENLIIPLNENSLQLGLVTGLVKDCNGKLLNNFVIRQHIDGEGIKYYFVKEKIDMYIPLCGQNSVKFSVTDINGLEVSRIVDWPSKDIIETGSWFACNQAQTSYFNLIIAGENKMYFDTKSQINTDGRMVLFINGGSKSPLSIYVPKDGIGIRNIKDLNIILDEPSFFNNGYEIKCVTSTQGCGFEKLYISHDGSGVDSYIRGHFKGRFWLKEVPSQKAGYKEMEGEFQILKSF